MQLADGDHRSRNVQRTFSSRSPRDLRCRQREKALLESTFSTLCSLAPPTARRASAPNKPLRLSATALGSQNDAGPLAERYRLARFLFPPPLAPSHSYLFLHSPAHLFSANSQHSSGLSIPRHARHPSPLAPSLRISPRLKRRPGLVREGKVGGWPCCSLDWAVFVAGSSRSRRLPFVGIGAQRLSCDKKIRVAPLAGYAVEWSWRRTRVAVVGWGLRNERGAERSEISESCEWRQAGFEWRASVRKTGGEREGCVLCAGEVSVRVAGSRPGEERKTVSLFQARLQT
ncbi:hypothetical protein BJY59DRAFT_698718 [Rhodotorula toruloides]